MLIALMIGKGCDTKRLRGEGEVGCTVCKHEGTAGCRCAARQLIRRTCSLRDVLPLWAIHRDPEIDRLQWQVVCIISPSCQLSAIQVPRVELLSWQADWNACSEPCRLATPAAHLQRRIIARSGKYPVVRLHIAQDDVLGVTLREAAVRIRQYAYGSTHMHTAGVDTAGSLLCLTAAGMPQHPSKQHRSNTSKQSQQCVTAAATRYKNTAAMHQQ